MSSPTSSFCCGWIKTTRLGNRPQSIKLTRRLASLRGCWNRIDVSYPCTNLETSEQFLLLFTNQISRNVCLNMLAFSLMDLKYGEAERAAAIVVSWLCKKRLLNKLSIFSLAACRILLRGILLALDMVHQLLTVSSCFFKTVCRACKGFNRDISHPHNCGDFMHGLLSGGTSVVLCGFLVWQVTGGGYCCKSCFTPTSSVYLSARIREKAERDPNRRGLRPVLGREPSWESPHPTAEVRGYYPRNIFGFVHCRRWVLV